MDEKDLLIQKLLDENAALRQLVKQQTFRITELEKRLHKNSSNSSKPPSSDGQPGHKGDTLKQVQTPDKIERHKVLQCPACRALLTSVEPLGVLKRQVFDIPPPKIEVTEHQAEIKVCSCCNKRVMAAFPYGVKAPVQYGEVIQSWAVYFQHQQFIPEDRLQETFNDLMDVKLATATLNGFSESVYDELADFDYEVLSKIQVAPVKHLDETGFRITSHTQWLHVASTNQFTYYHVSPKIETLRVYLLTNKHNNVLYTGVTNDLIRRIYEHKSMS